MKKNINNNNNNDGGEKNQKRKIMKWKLGSTTSLSTCTYCY